MFSLLLEEKKSAYFQQIQCSPYQNSTKFFTDPKRQYRASYGNQHTQNKDT